MPVINIEPPKLSRGRASSIDQKMLDEMVEKISNGFVSDGEEYPSQKKAAYEAGKWKRYVQNVRASDKIISRVWEKDGGTDVDKGKWVFALGIK